MGAPTWAAMVIGSNIDTISTSIVDAVDEHNPVDLQSCKDAAIKAGQNMKDRVKLDRYGLFSSESCPNIKERLAKDTAAGAAGPVTNADAAGSATNSGTKQ